MTLDTSIRCFSMLGCPADNQFASAHGLSYGSVGSRVLDFTFSITT